MKKWLIVLLVLTACVFGLWQGLRAPWEKLREEASARGLPPLAWFEIKRDLERCGSTSQEKKCVVEGGGGWFFYHESLINASTPWTDNTPAIIAFRDSLAARGIELIVVPVPDKLIVESSHYLRYSRADLLPKDYQAWVGRLQGAGVAVVDAMEAFRRSDKPMFEPYESHYTADARLLLARAVAETLQVRVRLPRAAAYTLGDTLLPGTGNLFHMRYGHYSPYKVREYPVKDAATGAPFAENKKAPVLVIGDSNVGQGKPSASHIGALIAAEAGIPTFSISRVGAGNSGPRFFKGKERFLQRRAALVWVFDGRELYGKFAFPQF